MITSKDVFRKHLTAIVASGTEMMDAMDKRIAALEAENARMRAVVEAVAKMDPVSDEARAISGVPGWLRHAGLIAEARAILASTNANDTAQKEEPPRI